MRLSVRQAHVVYLRNYVIDFDQVWQEATVPTVPRRRPLALLHNSNIKDEEVKGALGGWYWQGKAEVLGKNPLSVPLCPPQNSLGVDWDQTWATAVAARRPTAWAMTQSYILKSDSSIQKFSSYLTENTSSGQQTMLFLEVTAVYSPSPGNRQWYPCD